jgi:hypothetical protein
MTPYSAFKHVVAPNAGVIDDTMTLSPPAHGTVTGVVTKT